jgi:hypothetical protein
MSQSSQTTMPTLDDVLPPRHELVSQDKATYKRAWDIAYPILYRRAMTFASRRLGSLTDQEEVVILAIGQFQMRLLAYESGAAKKSDEKDNQPGSHGD